MIIQLCGLSGAGKTTIATHLQRKAAAHGIPVEIIDGDDYRKALCKDLGFSKEDRCENIRRLGFVASKLSAHGVICIISAINPYEMLRKELATKYKQVRTVFVDCAIESLLKRDTKGLYKRALLPDNHPDKLHNLTGINDPFETPVAPDLHLHTHLKNVDACVNELWGLIKNAVQLTARHYARM